MDRVSDGPDTRGRGDETLLPWRIIEDVDGPNTRGRGDETFPP